FPRYFYSLFRDCRDLHSFPTRRSSDLEQRLVLRLPSEPRDRAVVAVAIRHAGDRAPGDVEIRLAPDSQRALLTAVARHVGEDRRSEEHTSELQSRFDLVCRLLLEKKII